MGSEIAFRTMYSTSFAFYMDCLPACNQSPLKCGQYYSDYKWKPECFGYQNLVSLPTDSAIHMQISVCTLFLLTHTITPSPVDPSQDVRWKRLTDFWSCRL